MKRKSNEQQNNKDAKSNNLNTETPNINQININNKNENIQNLNQNDFFQNFNQIAQFLQNESNLDPATTATTNNLALHILSNYNSIYSMPLTNTISRSISSNLQLNHQPLLLNSTKISTSLQNPLSLNSIPNFSKSTSTNNSVRLESPSNFNIPLKKRMISNTDHENRKLSVDLSQWRETRVLALKKNFKHTDDLDNDLNFINYYPGDIETVNGTLVTVIHNEERVTFDVSKDEERFSLIEDAQARLDKLEKGILVLFRVSNQNLSSSSHSSTPTSIPIPVSNTSIDLNKSQKAIKYRLGRIIEKQKNFLVEPICLEFGSNSIISELVNHEWIDRPNLRLLQPPWFDEYKDELDLRFNLSLIECLKKFLSKQLQSSNKLGSQVFSGNTPILGKNFPLDKNKIVNI